MCFWHIYCLQLVLMAKSKYFYTEEELQHIKEKWLKDKNRIDEEYKGFYLRDIDKIYEKHFATKRLQKLFRHAAYLYRNMFESELFLHPEEEELIPEVYQEMIKNGYYSSSKTREKEVSARFGKAISRQTYLRFKKR